MSPTTIKVKKNGPYLITGDDVANVIVTDADGNRLIPGGKNITLCRCGASSTKPFCDGTHSKIGFQGAEQAAREFDAQHGGQPQGEPR
jgi:CDGSH-type Zn-finger protein